MKTKAVRKAKPVAEAVTVQLAQDGYAVRISTGNGKVGAAFSIPNIKTCPGRTSLCESLCYVDIWPMSAPQPTNFRERNYASVLHYLKRGDLHLKLIDAIDFVSTRTLRIHDAGDFFSPAYTEAWVKTVKATPRVDFWAYTRSFSVKAILPQLLELAKLPNCAIWLSADAENWMLAVATYKAHPEFAGIAFMETPDNDHITEILNQTLPNKNYVNFPTHVPGGRIKKGVDVSKDLPQCPAITGEIPHAKKTGDQPACLACKKCLPIAVKG